MRVFMIVRKNIVSKIVIKNRTDLASHPYYIILDFKKSYSEFRKMLRRTRIINFYDNKLREEYL